MKAYSSSISYYMLLSWTVIFWCIQELIVTKNSGCFCSLNFLICNKWPFCHLYVLQVYGGLVTQFCVVQKPEINVTIV